jgi:predicted PurR-regulated permease PerM
MNADPMWPTLGPNIKLSMDRGCAAVIVVLSAWVLNSSLLAVLVACVTAIASWPLYKRFADRMPSRLAQNATPLIFTALMTTFVLAPLTFAFRRIDSMNAFLFSLPGTRVIYFGDEIGMGDNPFLGDCNGVRTPIQ